MRIAILGVGLIGGSIGRAANERAGASVVGFDPRPATLERALELGAIEESAENVGAAVAGADVVFCAAPVGALRTLVGEALAAAGPEAVVTDVGSTKRAIVESIADEHAERFVGGHPLAGAETSGVEHASASLFEGARWYLTPSERTSGVLYERLARLVGDLGARPQAIDAGAHDRMMATISHLPHVLANALASRAASALASPAERLPDIGPSFRDATRVAGANPAMWAEIYVANGEAVAEEVEALAGSLAAAAKLIRSADRDALERWQAEAASARSQVAAASAPGGGQVELRVLVENRPGVVAEIALALGHAGVNIEDLALRPAADQRTGAVSLWVSGDGEPARAAGIVGDLGHPVTIVD